MIIPKFKEFTEMLHDRLHALVYHIEEMEGKFTLITNLLDRSGKYKNEVLIYAGADKQRSLLEEYRNVEKRDKSLDKYWNYLSTNVLRRDMREIETFRFFDQFIKHQLSLKDIKLGTLKSYFKEISNEFQRNERPVLTKYFNVSRDLYLSIPIIKFGSFEGVAHIIFKQVDKNKLNNPAAIKRLIKFFAMEYEGLLLDWDVVGENIEKRSTIKYDQLDTDTFYINKNPILSELKYNNYYRNSNKYLSNRLEQNNIIPNKILEQKEQIKEQHRRTAIITILIDSYAHNISAHSLTALNWWLRERAAFIDGDSKQLSELTMTNNPLLPNPDVDIYGDVPLAKEIQPLFKFLLEKGAFWSGITRQTNFAGKISSLYSILWYDFIGNPLYLGTIANSEKVNKIKLNLTIFEEEINNGNKYKNKKRIKKIGRKLLDGTFVEIDLKEFRKAKAESAEENSSVFIRKGTKFDVFKKELEEYKAFFPGGVVGKHAFFTLLENEIRNIKHYDEKELKKMQEKGLTLNLSIHQRYVLPKQDGKRAKELFKIGVWLKHPVDLDADLVVKRLDGLRGDIITDETYQPRLGGTFQDKICAAMLFNNEFSSVQNKNTSKRDEVYFPWIKAASSALEDNNNGEVIDFEISSRNYSKTSKKALQKSYKPHKGYLKKYFHLWKGADIYHICDEKEDFSWENLARFKFVYLGHAFQDQYNDLKRRGVIRILNQEDEQQTLADAYQDWLTQWAGKKPIAIEFHENKTPVGRIIYRDQELQFMNAREIEDHDLDDDWYDGYMKIKNKTILRIEHGGRVSKRGDMCNYRTHGILLKNICQSDSLARTKSIDPIALNELFESLISSITIFDKRLIGRIPSNKLNFYKNTLKIDFKQESVRDWNKLKRNKFKDTNFLVLHLSFIEKMKDANGKEYGEEGIGRFIEEQIVQGRDIEEMKKNFVLVITTGRGRREWWDNLLKTPYTCFTTFRPIESLISSIEDAIQMKDDIDLKYNFTKVLFGS